MQSARHLQAAIHSIWTPHSPTNSLEAKLQDNLSAGVLEWKVE
jgi:hypothetical protein